MSSEIFEKILEDFPFQQWNHSSRLVEYVMSSTRLEVPKEIAEIPIEHRRIILDHLLEKVIHPFFAELRASALLPKPEFIKMEQSKPTLEWAVNVLNDQKHRGFTDWAIKDNGENLFAWSLSDSDLGWFTEFEAIAIALSYASETK